MCGTVILCVTRRISLEFQNFGRVRKYVDMQEHLDRAVVS